MKYWFAIPIALANYYCVILFSTCTWSFSEALLTTVKNFRPVLTSTSTISTTTTTKSNGGDEVDPPTSSLSLSTSSPLQIFRSAALDNLSFDDAEQLLSGAAFEPRFDDGNIRSNSDVRPLAAIIDLRNRDEIRKGQRNRTDGSQYFYERLYEGQLPNDDDYSSSPTPRWIHIPILNDIDAFWDEAIDRMPTSERVKATLQTAFSGGALDRAAARNLEQGGLSELYTIMMETGTRPLRSAFQACVLESQRGPVLFHCQKGKDRTGVLAMLIQSCFNDDDDDNTIIQSYSLSGELIGEREESSSSNGENQKEEEQASGLIDWSHFRGSPASAMEDTLKWTRRRYGSVESYLETALSLNPQQQRDLLKQRSVIHDETMFVERNNVM